MTAILYEKLFEQYTKDGHTFEATLKYLTNIAAKQKIKSEIVELALNEIFADVANGRVFSKTECSCGCGIDKAATDLIHAIRDRILEIDKEQTAAVKGLMQKRYQMFLVEEMKRLSTFEKEREKLISGSLWERLTDWSTSMVYCFFKKQDHKKNKAVSKLKRVEKYKGK